MTQRVEALIDLESEDVIAIVPESRHIRPKACRRWIRDRVEPLGLAPKHNLRIRQMRFLIRSNLRQIRNRLGCDKPTARRLHLAAKADRDRFEAEGYDTGWGHGDLREFGVALCDLTPAEQRKLLRRQRRFRYRQKLSTETWVKWRDRNRRVDPPRESLTRFKWADFEARA